MSVTINLYISPEEGYGRIVEFGPIHLEYTLPYLPRVGDRIILNDFARQKLDTLIKECDRKYLEKYKNTLYGSFHFDDINSVSEVLFEEDGSVWVELDDNNDHWKINALYDDYIRKRKNNNMANQNTGKNADKRTGKKYNRIKEASGEVFFKARTSPDLKGRMEKFAETQGKPYTESWHVNQAVEEYLTKNKA